MTAVRKKYFSLLLLLFIALILIISVAALLGSSRQKTDPALQVDTAPGVAYLQSLEAKDPADVEERLRQMRIAEIQAQKDQMMADLTSGETSVWSMFEDYVLLGDSRAVGFEYFGYLPDERVMAESGATILSLEEHIPDIVALNPSNVFLCYGLNDVSIGIWPTPEDYVEDFERIIMLLRSELPGVNIYISSILPARDPAFNTSTLWYNIPEYSAAVSAMCDLIDCHFVDNTEICDTYADMWEVDGIHVRTTFYPYWAANLIIEYLDMGFDEEIEAVS